MPTGDNVFGGFGFPRFFSSTADSVLVTIVALLLIVWIGLGIIYFGRKYNWFKKDDQQALLGAMNAPKKKKIKRFEDYWGDESEDHTSRRFPTRAATNYDDYWDENVDFSAHSHDALNVSRDD